jgi:hypothetical protein
MTPFQFVSILVGFPLALMAIICAGVWAYGAWRYSRRRQIALCRRDFRDAYRLWKRGEKRCDFDADSHRLAAEMWHKRLKALNA